jgi:hypothetical protein
MYCYLSPSKSLQPELSGLRPMLRRCASLNGPVFIAAIPYETLSVFSIVLKILRIAVAFGVVIGPEVRLDIEVFFACRQLLSDVLVRLFPLFFHARTRLTRMIHAQTFSLLVLEDVVFFLAFTTYLECLAHSFPAASVFRC